MLNYDDDYYSPDYGKIKEASRALTKDDILQRYISDHGFRTSDIRTDDVGCNFFVFDVRCQQNYTATPPIELEFKNEGVVPHYITGHVLVLI